MTVFSSEYINRVKGGFQGDSVEKVLRLQELLKDFSGHPFIKDRIVLKGGTAINQFYSNLPRISVDIDLDYIGSADPEAMKQERPVLEKAMGDIFKGRKYDFEWGKDEHAGRKCELKYENFHRNKDRVKVDVNYLMRIPVIEPVKRKAFSFDEFNLEFPVLQIEELYAGKTKALLEREHPRDLYDLYRLFKGGTAINKDLWRLITILFCSSLRNDFRQYTFARIASITESEINALLYPLLKTGERPGKEEMLSAVQPRITELLSFKSNEKDYLDSLAGGVYDPVKLFGQGSLAEKLRKHPALLWKEKNIKEYLAGGKKGISLIRFIM